MNQMDGMGKYEFKSGAVYKGEFYNNLRHGRGQYKL